MSKSSVIVSATMVEMFSSIETVAMDIVAPDMIAPINVKFDAPSKRLNQNLFTKLFVV